MTLSRLKASALALGLKYQFEAFTAIGLGVVSGLFSRFHADLWFHEFQAGLLICLVAGVVHYFWPRRGLYWDLVLTNPLIALAIPLLLGISYGKLFPDLGFYYLFWSRPPWHPMVSSFAVVVTIAIHWLLLYFLYIDTYDVSLDPARGGGQGEGMGRFEQSQRHARRLWREFGLGTELEGNQPGWFVYESTKPFAVLLAIPALLPRFAVAKAPEDVPYLDSEQFRIAAYWLAGIVVGLVGVRACKAWIGCATRIDWVLRDRRQPDRQEGISALLSLGGVFAILAPVLAGLTATYYASRWSPTVSVVLSLVLIAGLFLRAHRLRRTAPAVSGLPSRLYNDYFFVLIGIFCFFLGVSLLIHWSEGAFASTVCICYLIVVVSALVALLDWLFTSQSYVRQMSTVLILLGLLLINGINPYKLQFDGLAGYYPDRLFGRGDASKKPANLREYQRREDRRFAGSREFEPPLLDDAGVLRRWAEFHERSQEGLPPGARRKPKLVVVACSGGALRAAIWTALVLGKLEEAVPDFPQSLRLITGASGGMLGAAHYVTALERDGTVGGVPRLRSPVLAGGASGRGAGGKSQGELFAGLLQEDFLTLPVQHLVFGDALGLINPFVQSLDRGKVLEQGWQDKIRHDKRRWLDRDVTFRTLLADEQLGARPSLVFTPMIVEDSRRLFISNLDLGDFTVNHGRFDPVSRAIQYSRRAPKSAPGPAAPMAGDYDDVFPSYSRMGYQFFRLFPEAHAMFPVTAAVRMSATFPFISPTVNLPTDPPLRVVDAGYYDNYGVNMASAWLEEHREWLLRTTSGVALIQIRAFTNEEKLRDYPTEDLEGTPSDRLFRTLCGWLDRGGQFLTSPLTGVANARQMVMSYRNDNEVEILKRRFTFDRLEDITGLHGIDPSAKEIEPGVRDRLRAASGEARDFFRVFTFTCGQVSRPGRRRAGRDLPPEVETMNWFVTEAEFAQFTGQIFDNNRERYDDLVGWLKSGPKAKPDAP